MALVPWIPQSSKWIWHVEIDPVPPPLIESLRRQVLRWAVVSGQIRRPTYSLVSVDLWPVPRCDISVNTIRHHKLQVHKTLDNWTLSLLATVQLANWVARKLRGRMAAGISLLPQAESDYNSDRLPSVIAHDRSWHP